jgi:Phosphotransferase enzyme family
LTTTETRASVESPPSPPNGGAAAAPTKVSLVVLDLADVASYLINKQLISARAVVDGGLSITDLSRLNRVFLVTVEGERCFILKGGGGPGDGGVAREAAVLDRLRSVDPSGELASVIPTLVGFDSAESVLILEATADERDLRHHHARGRFSRALAGEAGRALALVHGTPPAALKGLQELPGPMSWMQLHQPDLESLQTMSPAEVELTRIIQGIDDLCAALEELVSSWQVETVIHGDIRWDNLLAVRGGDSKRWTRLKLIDWELCERGDPAADIGSFFGEYLRAWLQSIPITDPRDPGRLLECAGLPLRRMRPALRGFWGAYTEHSPCTASDLRRRLRRGIRFAAVRLLMAALEEAHNAYELRARVLYLVPLSRNILHRPDVASADLLGLDAPCAAA